MDDHKFANRISPNYWTISFNFLGAIGMGGASLVLMVISVLALNKRWEMCFYTVPVGIGLGYIAYYAFISPLLNFFCYITITESYLELYYPLTFKRKIIQLHEIESFVQGNLNAYKNLGSPVIRIFIHGQDVVLVKSFQRNFNDLAFYLQESGIRKGKP